MGVGGVALRATQVRDLAGEQPSHVVVDADEVNRAGHPELLHGQSRARARSTKRDALAEPCGERLDDVWRGYEALSSDAVPYEGQYGTNEVPLGLHDHRG